MRMRSLSNKRWSPRPIAALLIVIALATSPALPVLAGEVTQFTDGTSERVLDPGPGAPDNSSRIAFPTDSRIRDASVLLRSDQELELIPVQADGDHVSAWASKPDVVDMSRLDLGPLMEDPFSSVDLTKVSINNTGSSKTTVSQNGSAHMFSVAVLDLLGSARRDVMMEVKWTGMATQQGTTDIDSVDLYIADFDRDRWYRWDGIRRVPSTGAQQHFTWTTYANDGWFNATGHVLFLAMVGPLTAGGGTSLTTSYFQMDLVHSRAPASLGVDVGDDGTDEFTWDGVGTGLYGLQNQLANGSYKVSADFDGAEDHVNVSSFLVPADAEIVEARTTLAGSPGEEVTTTQSAPEYIDAMGVTLGTRVPGISDHADPQWAQVVLTDLKNAGMKDQSQEILRDDQTIGNYGGGVTSVAQTFSPEITGKLVFINISIVGAVYDNPPDLIVEIRDTDGTGRPSDTVLSTSSIDGSLLNESSTKWHIVLFDGIDLVQDHNYSIVCRAPDAQAMETYEWKNHFITAGDPYPAGKAFVDDTADGSGPWFENANHDQAFITYMETDIGEGGSYIEVAGQPYSFVRSGPSGDEYVFNLTSVAKNETGVWNFPITNDNAFPVAFNWTGSVHSDVYPQMFGFRLSTDVAAFDYYTLAGENTSLDDYLWHRFTINLTELVTGAPVAHTAPNGVGFVAVNVTMHGEVTGTALLTGLRVRYYLDVELTGPDVVAAAEAYREANSDVPTAELPVSVSSTADASVLLSDPFLVYDELPTFTTQTQIIEEDGYGEVDLDTLFGDDYDNNDLTYQVVDNTEDGNLTAELNVTMLMLTPAHDWAGEADVTVRGTDSMGQHIDGVIKVVVTPSNDPPAIDVPDRVLSARARETKVLDLSMNISDPDNPPGELTVTTNSSFISVDGMVLYCLFDNEGEYDVLLTVSDGLVETNETLTFIVGVPVGYPTIVGIPNKYLVPMNRPLPVDLLQHGEDDEDDPGDLTWAVEADSPLFTAAISDGFNLTITPTGSGMGTGVMTLTLTNTRDNSVTQRVTVNVTDRVKEPPRIDREALPDTIDLEVDGDPEVIDLADYVEDETPIAEMVIQVAYTREGVVFVDVQEGVLSFVPQKEGRTKVTVTLTNHDQLSSSFDVTVDVSKVDEDGGLNWVLIVIVLIILAFIILVVGWPRRPAADAAPRPREGPRSFEAPPPRVDKVKPHMFRSSSLRTLEDVLLFHSSGLLMSQYTRQVKEGVDAELEGAVITAVQEHVQGRMRTRDEPTDLIELEGMKVVIERGADVAIAAVLSGSEPEGMRMHLRRSLNEVQTHNASVLTDWDGDLSQLRGVDNAMVNLVEGLIREHNGAMDLAVDGESYAKPGHPPPAVVEGVPPLEDEEEPLHLVRDIIGEDKTREIEEGHHEEPEEEGNEGD